MLSKDEEIERFKNEVLSDMDDGDDEFLGDSSDEDGDLFDERMSSDSDSDDIDTDGAHGIHPSLYQSRPRTQKGDRMWFRHHMGHLKVLKEIFREMDKDEDGSISFEEWEKFLIKNGVSRHFSEDQVSCCYMLCFYLLAFVCCFELLLSANNVSL